MASRRTGPLLLLLGLLLAGLVALVGWRLRGASDEPRPTAPATVATRAAPAEPTDRALEAPEQAAVPDADPAPAPTAARTLSASRSRRSEPERTAAADPELAAAWWVAGRVVLPPGTPLDERVEIEADGRDFEHRPHHRVEVEPDGSFRVAFSERTRHGRLQVHARHLYDPDPERFDVRDVEGELPPLELALGGRIEGQVILPADATEEERASLVGTQVVVSGPTGRLAALDEELRFAADALEPAGDYELTLDSEWFQDVALGALPVEPAETLEAELAPRRGVRLVGLVRLDGGGAVGAAKLGISTRHEGSFSWNQEWLGPDGRFDLRGVPAGEITLHAQASDALDETLELGTFADGAVVEDLELVLRPGAVVSGVVTWGDGRPAEGVAVKVSQDGSQGWSWNGRGKVETDAEGRFEVAGLEAGEYELTARAQQEVSGRREDESLIDHRRRERNAPYLTASHNGRAPQADLSLVLRAGIALSGRVTDDRGRGIEDFRVSARPYTEFPWGGGRPVSRHVRSSDGHFVLEGLDAGVWQVFASAKGHLDAEDRIVEVPLEAPLKLELAREPRVSGLVLTPEGGPPADRATVVIEPLVEIEQHGFSFDFDDQSRDLAEQDGSFEVGGLAGSCLLVASADGFADSEPVEVVLAPGVAVSDVVLRLRRGGRIEGRLEADQVSRVRIRARSSQHEFDHEAPETRTDSSGEFHFEALTPGEYLVNTVEEERMSAGVSFGTSWVEFGSREGGVVVVVEDGRTAQVVLDAAGSRVRVLGRVVRDGEPVAGASVWGYSVTQGGGLDGQGPTDADGRFELSVSRPGDYMLHLSQGSGGRGAARLVSIPSGPRHELEIDLSGPAIAGTVLADGQPVSGANVSLVVVGRDVAGLRGPGLWCETGVDGRFELAPVADGQYDLQVQHEGYAPLKRAGLPVVDGKAPGDLELHLQRGGTLTGTVLHASGDPAPYARVFVRQVGISAGGAVSDDGADELAAFRIEPVPPGRLMVVARSGTGWGQSAPVEVSPGGEASVDVVLEPATVLGVTVLEAGRPAPTASISVIDVGGFDHVSIDHRFGSGATFAGATHTVGPVPPGSYRVRATFSDGVVVERELTVDGEPSRALELAHP